MFRVGWLAPGQEQAQVYVCAYAYACFRTLPVFFNESKVTRSDVMFITDTNIDFQVVHPDDIKSSNYPWVSGLTVAQKHAYGICKEDFGLDVILLLF